MRFLTICILASALFLSACKKEEQVEVIDFEVSTISSSYFDKIKQENKGKVLVVNVFASWCPPCEAETPDFISVYEEHSDIMEIVGFSIDESLNDLNKFLTKHQVSYPIYVITQDLQRKLYAHKVPTTIIYRPNGMMYTSITGQIGKSDLMALVFDAAGKVQ